MKIWSSHLRPRARLNSGCRRGSICTAGSRYASLQIVSFLSEAVRVGPAGRQPKSSNACMGGKLSMCASMTVAHVYRDPHCSQRRSGSGSANAIRHVNGLGWCSNSARSRDDKVVSEHEHYCCRCCWCVVIGSERATSSD